MPCHCWTSDDNLEPEMTQIRNHIREIVKLLEILNRKGDFSKEGQSYPRDLREDIHKLLDDISLGKCSEGHEILKND